MASFQSFRSSSMPKRLLRYALSRLELLDADALNMDNLDFALGRNTVFEFRDVGVKLKKLENLLQLPAAIQLSRAKVLVLRVTVPMDFYTSPITVEVEGVEVGLKVDAAGSNKTDIQAPPSAGTLADVVPNTVDLAQSFLETQPSSERTRLEKALVAETHDLGASVSVSDDDGGSEDESSALGTGQALSLPDFLADFLRGVVDRTQVKIRYVRFHLDMDVPAPDNRSSPSMEPVSFQVALESVDVEGVTTANGTAKRIDKDASEMNGDETGSTAPIVPKEGKRHVSLANVRACLISEANAFSALSPSSPAPSPSTSPSATFMSRNPPSRQSTTLSQGSFREQPMASLQEVFRQNISGRPNSFASEERPLGDSEEALGIPYELGDESPPTPRASILLQDTCESPAPFNWDLSHGQRRQETEDVSLPEFDHGRLPLRLAATPNLEGSHPSSDLSSTSSEHSYPAEDLAQSHLYTHEEAESMYLSAFSTAESGESGSTSRHVPLQDKSREAVSDFNSSTTARHRPRPAMPGAWGEEAESSPEQERHTDEKAWKEGTAEAAICDADSTPRLSDSMSSLKHPEHSLLLRESRIEGQPGEQSDAATPKGPSRVVKEIMHLANVSIYVPSHRRHIHVQTGISPQPEAEQPSPPSIAPIYSDGIGADSVPGDASSVCDDALEVTLSPLSIHFDTSLGILLAMAFEKLLQAVQQEEPARAGKQWQRAAKSEMKKAPDFKLVAQKISLSFLSQLNGVADVPERHLNPPAFALDDDILLNATFQNLAVSTYSTEKLSLSELGGISTGRDAVVTKVDLERFRFGYADGDMISFDSSRPMTTSVRDVFLGDGCDVGIKIIRSDGLSKIDVETLPLVVQVDLQRLDETIGWFGGLSSFINMSASSARSSVSRTPSPAVLPVASPTLQSAPTFQAFRKPRPVVHFEAPSTDRHVQHGREDTRPTGARNKVNVRVGGALIELMGRECSIAAETNAIKVVGRDQGIGVACGRIRFTGPYVKDSYSRGGDRNDNSNRHHCQQTPQTTEVCGLRLELSPVPEDRDLEKLLELIIPSKVKFDEDGGGEIMVETLLRQRRKGSVLRITVETVNVRVAIPAQLVPALPNLLEEISKLSTTVAAKYLPEDDRPGLSLTKLQNIEVGVHVGGKIGLLESQLTDFEVAHITVPSLMAVAVRGITVRRNGTEDLVCSSPPIQSQPSPLPEERGPVIMARIIGDEMEPTIRVKLQELRIEYRVPTVMDALGLDDSVTPQEFEASLAASVASLADYACIPVLKRHVQAAETAGEKHKREKERPASITIGLRDCLLGLNPLNLPSKLFLALTDARVQADLPSSNGIATGVMEINKASLLLTDNFAGTEAASRGTGAASNARRRRHSATAASPQIASLCARGFVDICYISSARIAATASPVISGDNTSASDKQQVEVELRDDLLVLETCADSTQTLIALFNALKPPTPPSREDKFRTKVVPVQDLLASISAEAFGKPEGDYDFDYDFAGAQELAGSQSDADYAGGSRLLRHDESSMYDSQLGGEELFDATADDMSPGETTMQDTAEGVLLSGFDAPSQTEYLNDSGDDLAVHEDFYGQDEDAGDKQTAKLWNSVRNTYDRAPDALVKASPLKVSVKNVHVIWNLFDGYDWEHTREVIAKAVEDVEIKATERQQKNRPQSRSGGGLESYEDLDEDEETIGDFLFNSIYIGVPLNRDPRELTRAINQGLNDEDEDNTTETGSVATTTTNTTAFVQSMQGRHGRGRRLRLHRSKHHKITFEMQGVSADLVAYPPPEATTDGLPSSGGQETLSSIDVKVQTLDIFDHVPTSTWKKFATYDQDQGEREMGTSMVHLELLTVRPIPDLAASEIVLRAKVLPLRLHVDQDALDFITRFFEFKNEPGAGAPPSALASTSPGDIPFLQRAEVLDIPVKLDFKPKRVDYAGLRSGHTTEFMNFIVLEEARMVLRHVIVYGVSGFDRLGKTLNDIWTPDVRRNQLPGVVAGLAPVRSLVNIGSGFKDLVEIPLKEYRKDGRVVRSISKGVAAFARTTGTELVKLGAKLAVGTQYALQGAEEMLLAERGQRAQQQAQRPVRHATEGGRGVDDYDDEDLGILDEEDRKQISLYADQPTGVLQGIRGGFRSLTRDVNLARDAIIAVPGEVMESQSAGGAARAVLRRAPTIIFRPAVGVTKVIGQTLLGATNTMDPQNRRRIGEKYKH